MARYTIPLATGTITGLVLFAGAFTALCWFGWPDTLLHT